MGFHGSRLVFHGSRLFFHVFGSVFKVFHGPRLVFHVFFMAPGLVLMIPGGFLSSFMVPSWFKSELSAAGGK